MLEAVLCLIEFKEFIQLLDMGVTITMLWVFIRMFHAKDKQYEQSMQRMVEIVTEVTKALNDKNHSDNQMADALDDLVNVINDQNKEQNHAPGHQDS